jgi:hypothetical protein
VERIGDLLKYGKDDFLLTSKKPVGV